MSFSHFIKAEVDIYLIGLLKSRFGFEDIAFLAFLLEAVKGNFNILLVSLLCFCEAHFGNYRDLALLGLGGNKGPLLKAQIR